MTTIALLLFLAQGTTTTTAQTTTAQPPPRTAAIADDYAIGVADVISVTVSMEPDASRANVTVDNDGTIDMPLIGRVKVDGKPARVVEKEIADRLEKYLVKPQVSIEIVRYRSKSVYVQGLVANPGEKTLEGNASLTKVLAMAGSPSLDAASYVVINRTGADGKTTQIRVSRKQIESGEAQNILLKDGDVVVVPKGETFFINGYVRSPNSYAWEEGLTVERALTMAGGKTDRGGKIEIERKGKKVTSNAKLSDPVLAGDTIRVKQRIF